MTTETLSNFDDAKSYIRSEADTAELQKAYRKNTIAIPMSEVDGYRFVYNEDRDKVEQVVSDEYNLTQHEDFFLPALNAASEVLERPERIKIKDRGARIDVEVVPGERNHVDLGESGLEAGDTLAVGLRLSNSFDKSIRETIMPYALRVVCTNGMIAKRSLGRVTRYHRGEYDSEELVEDSSELVENAMVQIPELVGDAADRIVGPRTLADVELDEAGFGSGYRGEILERYDGHDAYDRSAWSLYNASTYVIDHQHDDVAEKTREKKHASAEMILTGETEIDGDEREAILEEARLN